MCVCVCVCVYTHPIAYNLYTSIHIQTYRCVYECVCMCVCMIERVCVLYSLYARMSEHITVIRICCVRFL